MGAGRAEAGHRLLVVGPQSDRRVLTAFPRGSDPGHQLCCGRCDMVLAWNWRPPGERR